MKSTRKSVTGSVIELRLQISKKSTFHNISSPVTGVNQHFKVVHGFIQKIADPPVLY